MRLLRTKLKILIPVLLVITAISAAVFARQQKKILVIEELETGNVYREIPVKTGDELSFQWEHSFEHIPWYEYYEIQKDGSFILHTIAVAGFGAGIPAEMDCKYRYEDGLVYMDEIESVFPQFNWINSQTALKNVKTAAEAAEAIGIGLQAFCIDGSVAEDRKVGLGHGNLGAMLLRDETKCFAFLAGHESFAAAEGAIGIARSANKARKEPLRVILNGLGKDAAQIISRINGFTYVQTKFDYYTGELKIVKEYKYSDGERAAVRCFGADDVREGVILSFSSATIRPKREASVGQKSFFLHGGTVTGQLFLTTVRSGVVEVQDVFHSGTDHFHGGIIYGSKIIRYDAVNIGSVHGCIQQHHRHLSGSAEDVFVVIFLLVDKIGTY